MASFKVRNCPSHMRALFPSASGPSHRKPVACFADARGTVHERGITATVYTVNQDADLWHVLYAWHYRGGLYSLSEHVALPLTYAKV